MIIITMRHFHALTCLTRTSSGASRRRRTVISSSGVGCFLLTVHKESCIFLNFPDCISLFPILSPAFPWISHLRTNLLILIFSSTAVTTTVPFDRPEDTIHEMDARSQQIQQKKRKSLKRQRKRETHANKRPRLDVDAPMVARGKPKSPDFLAKAFRLGVRQLPSEVEEYPPIFLLVLERCSPSCCHVVFITIHPRERRCR